MRKSRLQFLIEAQDRTGRAFSALQEKLAVSESRLARLRSGFTAASAAATAFGASIGAIARSVILSANETERFARVANAAPETFQRWAAASSSVGIEQDKLADILKDVNDRVGDFLATGGGPMADFFENIAPKVGVTAEQFARLSGPQALQLYVDSLQKAGVTQGEMTFYLEAMASDLTMLLPLLQNSGAEMERLGQRAEEFGAVMDGKTLMSISRVQTAMNEVGLVFKGAAYQMTRELAPSIERVANAFTNAAREGGLVRRSIDGLTSNIERLATYALTAATAFGVRYVGALVLARLATLRLSTALIFLRGALIRTGFGVLIVAAGEMVYQFGRLVSAAGGFGEAMSLLGELAGNVWQGIIDSAQAIPPALNGVWAKMKAGFLAALSGMAFDFSEFASSLGNQLMDIPGLDGAASKLIGVADAATTLGDSLGRAGHEANSAAEGSFASAAATIAEAFGPARESVAKMRDLMKAASEDTDGAADAADRLNSAMDRIAGDGGDGDGGGSAGKAAKAMNKIKDEATKAADRMQKAFDDVAKSIGDAMAGAIVQGKSMGEALRGVFNKLAQDLLSSGITQLIKGLFGGAFGGGGGIGKLFAGFFDGGGMIPNGQLGIAGERGPELIRGPAHVTSTADTAKMMGGGSSTMNINVNVDGANGDDHVIALVQQGVSQGIGQYDRALPDRIAAYQMDPEEAHLMASITFPLGVSDFWDDLRVSSVKFTLGEAMSMAETAGGEVLTARRGVRLWSGMAEVTPAKPNDQDQVMALIDLIRQPGASFMVYDHQRKNSQHDPDGSHQGATVCTVSSVASDRREITLKGLPVGYVLTRGDHVSIAYGSSPVRYYLGRVVHGDTFAPGTPTTATVELAPTIPPGVAADDVVSLVRPSCKAVYVPGSLKELTRRPVNDTGFSFQWTQTLR